MWRRGENRQSDLETHIKDACGDRHRGTIKAPERNTGRGRENGICTSMCCRARERKREREWEWLRARDYARDFKGQKERERGIFPSLSVSVVFYWPHVVTMSDQSPQLHTDSLTCVCVCVCVSVCVCVCGRPCVCDFRPWCEMTVSLHCQCVCLWICATCDFFMYKHDVHTHTCTRHGNVAA